MNDRFNVLALDFDGVICDGIDECLITAWNTYYDKTIDAFSDTLSEEIPDEFRKSFLNCRGYVRYNGHFIMPFMYEGRYFDNQKEFDDAYESISSEKIEDFNKRFQGYREAVRTYHQEDWLDHHALYDGMVEIISHSSLPLYIVTAKDQASVALILCNRGVELSGDYIYGEQTDKNIAFRDICKRESVAPEKLNFVDDNLPNVIRALDDGYTAMWATWGYNTHEHHRLASDRKIVTIDNVGQLSKLIRC